MNTEYKGAAFAWISAAYHLRSPRLLGYPIARISEVSLTELCVIAYFCIVVSCVSSKACLLDDGVSLSQLLSALLTPCPDLVLW